MGWFKSLFCGVKWFFGIDGEEPQDDPSLMKTATPFITAKKSRMYYDEDGDLADEFYEEVIPNTGAPWMRRVTEHLTWQGIVPLDIQRLHPDFPVAIYHAT